MFILPYELNFYTGFKNFAPAFKNWSGWRDSNSRPTAPKAVALPGCATPRNLPVGTKLGAIGEARNNTPIKNNRQLNIAEFINYWPVGYHL